MSHGSFYGLQIKDLCERSQHAAFLAPLLTFCPTLRTIQTIGWGHLGGLHWFPFSAWPWRGLFPPLGTDPQVSKEQPEDAHVVFLSRRGVPDVPHGQCGLPWEQPLLSTGGGESRMAGGPATLPGIRQRRLSLCQQPGNPEFLGVPCNRVSDYRLLQPLLQSVF